MNWRCNPDRAWPMPTLIWLTHCACRASGIKSLSTANSRSNLIPISPKLITTSAWPWSKRGNVPTPSLTIKKALALRPHYADAHHNLGLVLAQKGQWDEAIAHYQKAIALRPDYAQTHYSLGVALAQKGQWDDAIAHYQKALDLRPDYAEAHYNLGRALVRKGQWAAAIAHYQQALALQPGALLPRNNLAWLLATCPQATLRNGAKSPRAGSGAGPAFRREDGDNLDVLAAAYAEAGQFPQAVEAAGRALALAAGQTNLNVEEIRARLKLYQNRSPFHETPRSP